MMKILPVGSAVSCKSGVRVLETGIDWPVKVQVVTTGLVIMRDKFLLASAIVVIVTLLLGMLWSSFLWLFLLIVPAIAAGLYDMQQTRHSLRRNFPLVARGRWVMEFFRPFLRQYLLESETDGTPISRMFRSVIYQRAKGARDTVPFGTKVDTYREGYEWISHSMAAHSEHAPISEQRVLIGGKDCRQPYSASLLNVSAMSFGSLSKNAIRALNSGAAKGNFAHNTGEGGATPYHLENDGDLIWQIGTGYFGCRTLEGDFEPTGFREVALKPSVKMIEIKLSQGAKPGHGGILPAIKNTPEIAQIRGVKVNTTVFSPASHSAFSTPIEMMEFIDQLRELSDGKPIGFKLCIGRSSEFVALCKAMIETGITPDFITVDGGEGGTGAAPLEFSNSIGMPLRDALAFVDDCLTGFGLREEVRIIASGKIFSGFHVVKNLALGADVCCSARGMMLALGCVQSLICNTNHCPTGVATQNEGLSEGLIVTDKSERVARFQHETVERALEIVAAAGLSTTQELNRTHIYRRINYATIARYDEIFPYMVRGRLLESEPPEIFAQAMAESTASSFQSPMNIAMHHSGLKPLQPVASAAPAG